MLHLMHPHVDKAVSHSCFGQGRFASLETFKNMSMLCRLDHGPFPTVSSMS